MRVQLLLVLRPREQGWQLRPSVPLVLVVCRGQQAGPGLLGEALRDGEGLVKGPPSREQMLMTLLLSLPMLALLLSLLVVWLPSKLPLRGS